MTRHTRRETLGLIAATCAAAPLHLGTAHAKYGEEIFLDSQGHAIKGYDPVAYFEVEEAIKGTLDFTIRNPDATWLFSRIEHLEMYRRDPERYQPQFGGFCAEAMARGFKRRSDPTLWVKIDGKVYLHYSIPDQNRWADDIRGNIRAAEESWIDIRSF